MDIDGIQFLQVTSKIPKTFRMGYHGVEYTFKLNEPVTLPRDAARHIFGFGEDDKSRALHRLGWLTTTQQIEGAMKKLKEIKFEPVKQVYEIDSAREKRDAGIPGDAATGMADVKGVASES